jgi:hypothetical protein
MQTSRPSFSARSFFESRFAIVHASILVAGCGGSPFTFPAAGTPTGPDSGAADAASAPGGGGMIDAAPPPTAPAPPSDAESPAPATPSTDSGSGASPPSGVGDAGPGTSTPPDASDANPGASMPPDAGDLLAQLLALTKACTVASNGTFATDSSASAGVSICKLNGAFFWTADLSIDCDGQSTSQCNPSTDPGYTNQTSFTQSDGQALIASVLPYVVLPLPSSRFDYNGANVRPGALAIVIYGGVMSYGVFGDVGPADVIGGASYAMAQSLGIDPSPSNGGTSGPVTYFVFTGQGAVVSPIEDHAGAVTLGGVLAPQLVADN